MKIRKINDLERLEKPREKLQRYGAGKLKDYELLSILLRTGYKNNDVLKVSKEVLDRFDINKLKNISINDLCRIDGIGTVKAGEILSAIELGRRIFEINSLEIVESPQDLWRLTKSFRESKKEHFYAYLFNSRSALIHSELISVGTINYGVVHPREVFEPAIRMLSTSIIISHNHPSENVNPSDADIEVTKKLSQAGKLLDIEIRDHVIVSRDNWFSFRENGLI